MSSNLIYPFLLGLFVTEGISQQLFSNRYHRHFQLLDKYDPCPFYDTDPLPSFQPYNVQQHDDGYNDLSMTIFDNDQRYETAGRVFPQNSKDVDNKSSNTEGALALDRVRLLLMCQPVITCISLERYNIK